MKNDIGTLTTAEKNKLARRHKFVVGFFKVYPACLVVTGLITVFGIYMASADFNDAFSPARAAMTTGLFVMQAMIAAFLIVATYFSADDKRYPVRNTIVCFATFALTYMASVTTSMLFNIFALPLCLSALIVVALSGSRSSTITSLALASSLFITFIHGTSVTNEMLPQVLISVIGSFVAALAVNMLLDRHYTRLQFILVALGASAVGILPVVIGTLLIGDLTINILLNAVWSYGAAIGAVLVFTPIVAIMEGIFNIADDFRLNELANLNHPLLKRLASEAPGTFNHSLVVGNLSEACANAIGENPHLARAAAYYHDIGKLKAPVYFSENQSTYNPHDELIPEVSVSMITSHTVFGEILAKQYRLPPEIVSVCREHHGTSPVGYFYRKALNLTEEGELSVSGYTYPGPKPQSKISAIVMIADTVEAACRSYMPDTKEAFAERVDKLVDEKVALGQFDECPITMADIATIKATIIETLPRVQHGRVSYEKKKA